MKKAIIVIVVIVVVVGAVFFVMNKKNSMSMTNTQMQQMSPTSTQSTSNEAKPAAKNAVTIQNFAFSPATITVKAGDSITWTNQDSIGHSATADDKSFDTGVLAKGQSKSVTFSKPGTYTYYCSVHPNMKATVVVQ